MVQAWYMDDSTDVKRKEHQLDPPQPVSLDDLKKLGVFYHKLNAETHEQDGTLQKLRLERYYNYEDRITIAPGKLENFEKMDKIFYTEHLHEDEEVRFITEGSGYFDVRDKDERWIRIKCVPGDLLILSAGIYHRFTLDETDYIVARRLFAGVPVWTAHDRPSDDMACRKTYQQKLVAGF